MSATVDVEPPAGETMDRGKSGPLPNQPGLCALGEGYGICTHKGTTSYPAHDGMLDAGKVSGIYDFPGLPCISLDVKGVPALGFLCMIEYCGPIPCCCFCIPFNCCPTPPNYPKGGCGVGGPKAAPCLPDNCTLAATWFCLPPWCIDWHDVDTMLVSYLCCCPMVYKKTKQGAIIC